MRSKAETDLKKNILKATFLLCDVTSIFMQWSCRIQCIIRFWMLNKCLLLFLFDICFNLIFQCIYTCTYFFRPLARLYGVCHIVSYYTFYRPGNHNAINVLNDPSISVLYHNVLFCVSFVYCISRVNIMCVCILTCILC